MRELLQLYQLGFRRLDIWSLMKFIEFIYDDLNLSFETKVENINTKIKKDKTLQLP